MRKMLLFSAVSLSIILFACTDNTQSPFSRDKAKVYITMLSSSKVTSNEVITDTAGNKIRIGISLFLPDYFDSVVVTIGENVQNIDTFFVYTKPEIKSDTIWYECSFVNAGLRTVNAVGYVEGGYRPSAGGIIAIIARTEYPAIITGFHDTNGTINDSIAIVVTATDPEGIKEYQWDFDGDGVTDKTTSSGNVKFVTKPVLGVYKIFMRVVDNAGNTTNDTATITVTNGKPQAKIILEHDTVGLHIPIHLHVNASDDGRIVSFEWKFNNLPYVASTKPDTTFYSPSENLPTDIRIMVRVRDDDGNEAYDSTIVHAKMNWREVNESTIFSTDAQMVYFAKKLWLYKGGKGGDTLKIWSSDDSGKTWIQQSNSQSFPRSYGFSLIALQSKIVKTNSIVVSGQTTMFLKDVWSSADGLKWHLDTIREEYPDYSSPPAPCLFAYSSKVYLVDYSTNVIWYADTSNTAHWDSVSDLSYLNRNGFRIVPYQDKFYLVGGSINQVPQIDVLVSTDLISWTTATNNAGFPRRAYDSFGVYGGKMWAIGGDANGQDAWYSADGITWKLATNQFPATTHFTASDDLNCLWLMGNGGIWYCTDKP